MLAHLVSTQVAESYAGWVAEFLASKPSTSQNVEYCSTFGQRYP